MTHYDSIHDSIWLNSWLIMIQFMTHFNSIHDSIFFLVVSEVAIVRKTNPWPIWKHLGQQIDINPSLTIIRPSFRISKCDEVLLFLTPERFKTLISVHNSRSCSTQVTHVQSEASICRSLNDKPKLDTLSVGHAISHTKTIVNKKLKQFYFKVFVRLSISIKLYALKYDVATCGQSQCIWIPKYLSLI